MWSLAMIVRDAEATIGQVLDDASAFCDELMVVDTGSTDNTMRVALNHGATLRELSWRDDFSHARNYAFSQCSGDWIVWLDADDRVPPKAQEAFLELKAMTEKGTLAEAILVDYRIEFDADGNCTFAFPRERVVQAKSPMRWVGPVHECMSPMPAVVERSDSAWVEHRPEPGAGGVGRIGRNLRILRRAVAGGDDSTRTLFYLGNELADHGVWMDAWDVYARYTEREGTMVWEKHYALLKMAGCAENLGWSDELVLGCLHEAIQLDPTRAEGFLRAGKYHFDRKRWDKAVRYFTAAAKPRLDPPRDGFVHLPSYGYLAYDYLASCAWELGYRADAEELTMKALSLGSPERDRLNRNLGFYRAGRNVEPGPPEGSPGSH